jgi:hypothetical protein
MQSFVTHIMGVATVTFHGSICTVGSTAHLESKSPRGTDPTSRSMPTSAKLVQNFEDRGCRMASATNPHGRILGFLDRSRYFFFGVDPQLYSRG